MTLDNQTARPRLPLWRFYLGLLFFGLSLTTPVFIPLVTASGLSAAWKTAIGGLLVFGIPQLFTLAAIAILGKSGFNYLKSKLFGFLKGYAPPQEVSQARYRFGLVLFLIPLFFGWFAPYVSHLIPGYESHRFWVNLIGDLIFIASLFILGGEFWDKLRALFIYEAKVQIPLRPAS
jgi:hypothetical protein